MTPSDHLQTLNDGNRRPLAGYGARRFHWHCEAGVASITLNRPQRKNPLTFASHAELRDLFGALKQADDAHAVVITGAGGNFCSGGDVHEIIGPLLQLPAKDLLMFTRMPGELVKAMRVGHDARAGHRGRGPGPGDLHAGAGFQAGLRGFCRQAAVLVPG